MLQKYILTNTYIQNKKRRPWIWENKESKWEGLQRGKVIKIILSKLKILLIIIHFTCLYTDGVDEFLLKIYKINNVSKLHINVIYYFEGIYMSMCTFVTVDIAVRGWHLKYPSIILYLIYEIGHLSVKLKHAVLAWYQSPSLRKNHACLHLRSSKYAHLHRVLKRAQQELCLFCHLLSTKYNFFFIKAA